MTENISERSIVVAADRQVSSDFIEDEIVVLDVEDGQYYTLNPVAARIWKLVQEPMAVDDIIGSLMQEYDVPADRCRTEVMELLRDLAERKLIEIRNEAA